MLGLLMVEVHELSLGSPGRVADDEVDDRGSDSDAFLAVYPDSRHELLESIGISCDEVARTGDSLALSELSLKFLGPLR
ncbi:hypothetical protein Gohar_020687, partial [Gossypium harknessii]|nr:hypothetical protein [Gossypium harknessii]